MCIYKTVPCKMSLKAMYECPFKLQQHVIYFVNYTK